MKPLRRLLDRLHPHFKKGGKLERLYPIYEAADTFLYTPGTATPGPSHIRDGLDLKRMMIMVVYALIPCVAMAFWNTGYQANLVIADMLAGGVPLEQMVDAIGWRAELFTGLGLEFNPDSFVANVVYGGLWFLPVVIVTFAVGGIWEVVFACVRGHEINEGFLVTGALFPLILPPTIPLWQVALGISFAVVLGKEIFGGTGRNFLNPALTGRAFLFFAYPAEITGDRAGGWFVWIAAPVIEGVDAVSGATPLTRIATADERMEAITGAAAGGGLDLTWLDTFLGVQAGSMGETSTLACLLGAILLLVTGVGSWRIMLSMLVSTFAFAWLLFGIGSDTNPAFALPPWWHLTTGGFAFGLVFMATDPVSATLTETGKWFYGVLIGFMTVLIRVINPAFPEGVMLAILFGNVVAPLIDYLVLQANIKRRMARDAA